MTALLLASVLVLAPDQEMTLVDKPGGEDAFRAQSQFRIDPGGAIMHGQALRFALTHRDPIQLSVKARRLKKSAGGSFVDDGPAAMVLVKLEDAAGKAVFSTTVQTGSGNWTIKIASAALSQWRLKLPPLQYGWTPWKLTVSAPPMLAAPIQVEYDLKCGGASIDVGSGSRNLPAGQNAELRLAFATQFEGTYLVRAWAEGAAGREAGAVQTSHLVLGPKAGEPIYDRTREDRHDFMVAVEKTGAGAGKTATAVVSTSSGLRPLRLLASVRLQPKDRSLGPTKF